MRKVTTEVMLRRLVLTGGLLLLLGGLPMGMITAGCGDSGGTTGTMPAVGSPIAPVGTDSGASAVSPLDTSALEPIVVPTLPDVIPGYTEVDPATGLHVTGTPQVIDLAEYRLAVSGKVARELTLAYDELRSLPKVTSTPRLVCAGVFVDVATWSGAPLTAVLDMAGIQPDAKKIKMVSADGYWVFLDLKEALQTENFLAYELMGQPLPVLHGFPLRAVIPAKNGNLWVKWLQQIVVE